MIRERPRSFRRALRSNFGIRRRERAAPHLIHSIFNTNGFANTLATKKAVDANGNKTPETRLPRRRTGLAAMGQRT